jgi:hypothetical protein
MLRSSDIYVPVMPHTDLVAVSPPGCIQAVLPVQPAHG